MNQKIETEIFVDETYHRIKVRLWNTKITGLWHMRFLVCLNVGLIDLWKMYNRFAEFDTYYYILPFSSLKDDISRRVRENRIFYLIIFSFSPSFGKKFISHPIHSCIFYHKILDFFYLTFVEIMQKLNYYPNRFSYIKFN